MALAVTLLGTATFDTASGTKTVTATPAVGDLIVIVTAHSGNVSSATPTDNNSSGAYTRINSAVKASSADTLGVHVRNALIGSAVSTVFSHAPGTSTGGGLAVFKVTGMQKVGAAAARQSAKQDNIASGTPTPVLGQAALTTDALIAALFNATNPAGMTPRSSPAYTERCDVGYNTPASGLETMSINSGETGTSIAWGGTSASAFCSLVMELDANQALTPGLFTNSQSFPAPTLTSVYGLTPSLLSNSASFFGPTISQSTSLAPSLVTNSANFFAPTVTPGAVNLAPSLIASTASFFAPSLSSLVTLAPSLVSDADGFFAPAISTSYSLAPSKLSNGQSFPAATVSPGAVNLAPSLVSDGDTFHAPTVSPGPVSIGAPLVASGAAFHSPTVSNAGGGSATLLPSLLTNSPSFSVAAVSASNEIAPSLVANDNGFSPVIVSGAYSMFASLLANDNEIFAPTVGQSTGVAELLPPCIWNEPGFFTLAARSRDSDWPLQGMNGFFPLTVSVSWPLDGMVQDYPLRRSA